ncbi:Gfo/Idh/MocA family oxidoreductase [Alicyclobacillus cycloheptanicus]|jgi:predicted homoserine dehydrogenase-like protein|uniref:Homoserine dehydrogenase-like protein n=1 Tax=Alicyclobacillus cycloheptanicus TaxID=1457 RepID=A0ABT9XLL8_9BACL|nr:SAF domain-containing protein [Alicyclobacillus cycloheptanicus]MDQ0191202.1 putative homoserine dehydrogenase-like protein [Alicyclobacillus cycloheptanicus]WDM02116.1 Gfo/Idh/MocA family oxidoreductase [Alicyclobacillus cycloheptanicus]
MSIYRELLLREKAGQSIGVAVIGAGQMGRGLIAQISRVPGMRVAGVCDVNLEAAQTAVRYYQLQSSYPNNEVAVSSDFRAVIERPDVDAVVDATGVPEVGARIALHALTARKHLVLLNVEADVTIGSILSNLFKAGNLVYTGSAGDEPAVTLELVEFARTIGLEVVVAGKGKNNPFIPSANPDTCAEEANRKHMSPHMLAAFQDGTKTMAEMNLLSNATGLIPDVVGMHGVHADIQTVVDQLRLVSEGGCLNHYGVVEYVHGLAPGVFVIVKSPLEPVDEELRYLSVGKGPYYALYRPFHLASLETPISVARAVLHNDPTIAPLGGPVSETVAVAKRPIRAGEPVDGIGGYAVRGVLERHEEMEANGHVPIGLIAGRAVAKRDIADGQFLTADDIELDGSTTVWHLRELQNQLFR